jgi:hypothetical protein
MAAVNWVPIEAAKLRVGHYVRIGHRWLDHPFIQHSFTITSPNDVAIIRAAGLTKLFIDPARSMAVPDAGSEPADAMSQPAEPLAVDFERLHNEKTAYARTVRRQRDELATAQRRYGESAERAEALLLQIDDGGRLAAVQVAEIIQSLLADLAGADSSPLAFAGVAKPLTMQRRLAFLSLDAATIAGLVGRRLGLEGEAQQVLATAAMLHSVGLSRIPVELRDERHVSPESLLGLQDYPLLGMQQLRSCGGFEPDVMKIVRQHREHLDGSGFPEGASERDIHPHAPIVGAIREFQLLTVDAGLTPAAALARLYRERRGHYGEWAVDNLIATLTVYPPGTFLGLSDGSIARVMRVSTEARRRPLVSLFDEQVEPQEAEILDLSAVRGVSVASVLNPASLARPVLDFFGSSLSGFAVASASDAASLAA